MSRTPTHTTPQVDDQPVQSIHSNSIHIQRKFTSITS